MELDSDHGPVGIIWRAAGGGNKDRISDKHVGGHVKAYLDELEDGESITITFHRHDLTDEEFDAIPET